MAKLVDPTLECLACGRMGRDRTLLGRCRCGALNWAETAPDPPHGRPEATLDRTLQCLECRRMGRDPALLGRCVCGASNWHQMAPPTPARTPPAAPPAPRPDPSPAPRPSSVPPPAEGWLVTKCRGLPDCPRRFPRDG